MACFVAPTATAAIVALVKKKVPKRYHIEWLLLMLWGGALMLVVDHMISGEVVWYFPFFTRSFSDISVEIVSVGIPMVGVTFIVWGCMVFIANGGIQTAEYTRVIENK